MSPVLIQGIDVDLQIPTLSRWHSPPLLQKSDLSLSWCLNSIYWISTYFPSKFSKNMSKNWFSVVIETKLWLNGHVRPKLAEWTNAAEFTVALPIVGRYTYVLRSAWVVVDLGWAHAWKAPASSLGLARTFETIWALWAFTSTLHALCVTRPVYAKVV